MRLLPLLLFALAAPLYAQAPDSAEAYDAEAGVHILPDEMPELIGGLRDLQERARYPAAARRHGIQGTVFVQFIVDEEGSIRDAEVVRGVAGLNDEALRVIRESRFKPGRVEGQPVAVRFGLPVRFKLRAETPSRARMPETRRPRGGQW